MKWFVLSNDYTTPGRRDAWIGRVHCSVCDATWTGLWYSTIRDGALLSRLPLFPEVDVSDAQTLDDSTLRARIATIEEAIPVLRGLVGPGMSFGRFAETSSRPGRPRRLQPVEWASLFGGILLSPHAVEAVAASGLVTDRELLEVSLLTSRADRDDYRELDVPIGGALDDTTYEGAGDPCRGCGRRSPGPRWEGFLSAEAMSQQDRPMCRLHDWPGRHLIREDLAAVLGSLSSPTLRFEPVELSGGRRVREPRRHVLAFDTSVAARFLRGARTSHELWHGAHLLSETRRNIAESLVNPSMRRYPGWERPTSFDLEPCAPPLRRRDQPALGVEGPVVLSYELPDHAGAKENLRNAVMAIGAGWGTAARLATDVGADLLAERLEQRDLEQWASDWLDIRFTETAGEPGPAEQDARQRFRSGQTHALGTTSERPVVLGESVLKSRRHGALFAPWRVRHDEELDVLQFVRRFGAPRSQFPSMARVAAQPWLEGLSAADAQALVLLAKEAAVPGYSSTCVRWITPFVYDAEFLFRHRWPDLETEARARTHRDIRIPTAPLEALLAGRDPDPQVALLVAAVADELESDAPLRRWALDAFEIIHGARGAVVSATPHEVLALLPMPTAGGTAIALRRSFPAHASSLSVGVGAGRIDEPIWQILDRARRAAASACVGLRVPEADGSEESEIVGEALFGALERPEDLTHPAVLAAFVGARDAVRRARR